MREAGTDGFRSTIFGAYNDSGLFGRLDRRIQTVHLGIEKFPERVAIAAQQLRGRTEAVFLVNRGQLVRPGKHRLGFEPGQRGKLTLTHARGNRRRHRFAR